MFLFLGVILERLFSSTLTPWVQCYKTFYVRILRMFVIS